MIDTMFQEGTDAAIRDQIDRPAPKPPAAPSFNLGGFAASPFRGIGAGIAKTIGFGAEITGAFGQVQGAYGTESAGGMFSTQSDKEAQQANAARAKLATEDIDYSNDVGDAFRQRAADILPDPKTAHTSEVVVAGLADYATRAVGYGIALGPLASAGFGADVGFEEADRLKQQGVDLSTRTKAGVVAGVLNAAAMSVPLSGPTALVRFGKGVAAGEGAMVGQSLAEREIVRAAGYDKLADTFDPLDPVALALGVVPGAIGARFGHATARQPHPGAAPGFEHLQAAVDAARLEADRIPVLQAEMAKAETSAAERAKLQREIDTIRSASEQTHAQAMERATADNPDFVPAARVGQVVEAVDAARLTPDADLAGRDAHLSAVEWAHDQMARGEDVSVRLPEPDVRSRFEAAMVEDSNGKAIEGLRAKFDNGQGGEGVMELGIRDGRMFPTWVDNAIYGGENRSTGGRVRQLYESAIAEAEARGLRFTSDDSVTADAHRIYESLARRGYDVSRNAAARDAIAPEVLTPRTMTTDGSPVYTVERSAARRLKETAAAVDELRAARTPPEPKAPREPAAATKEPRPGAGEATKQEPAAQPSSGPQAARSGEGEGAAPSGVARAAAEAEALNPDMMVQLEGMDAPMRVGDLMAKVKEEARQDTLAGKLLEVAAACDLRA